MLDHSNFNKENILKICNSYHVHPSIVSQNIASLYLLEALSLADPRFILRGGMAMLLLLQKTYRFTSDIDIAINSDYPVDQVIKQVSGQFPFIRSVEEHRKVFNKIPKRHFEFWYESPVTHSMEYIHLDIIIDHCEYSHFSKCRIMHDLSNYSGDIPTVNTPDINCLLGEKLTSIGIPNSGPRLDPIIGYKVIKQLFDCSMLFQHMNHFDIVCSYYKKEAEMQMDYYSLDLSVSSHLLSIIQSCLCIASRGAAEPEEYKKYLPGIYHVQDIMLSKKDPKEEAGARACVVLYLAAHILSNSTVCPQIIEPLSDKCLNFADAEKLNYLKDYAPCSYTYLVEGFRLIEQYLATHSD